MKVRTKLAGAAALALLGLGTVAVPAAVGAVGDISTVSGTAAYTTVAGDGQLLSSVHFGAVAGVVSDAAGNLWYSDLSGNGVEFVPSASGTYYGRAMTVGHVYVLAGTGSPGYAGDGGPATSAALSTPLSIAVDPTTMNVAIADRVNCRVRLIADTSGTYFGQSMAAGEIATIAGTGTNQVGTFGGAATGTDMVPEAVAFDASGNLYVADGGSDLALVPKASGTYFGQAMTADDVYDIAGDGSTTGISSGSGVPTATGVSATTVAVDASGDLAIGDSNGIICFIPATSATYFGQAMTAGTLYVVAGGGSSFTSGSTGTAEKLTTIDGVAFDNSGDLYVSESNGTVSALDVLAAGAYTHFGVTLTSGEMARIMGGASGTSFSGGTNAALGNLYVPGGIAVDGQGTVLVANLGDQVIDALAPTATTDFGVAMTAGDFYPLGAGTGRGWAMNGQPLSSGAFSSPEGIAFDAAGDFALADSGDSVIDYVPLSSGTYFGQSMTASDLYVIAGTGATATTTLGLGALATTVPIGNPGSVALAPDGSVAFAANNDVDYVPASSGTFYGQAMTAGHLYRLAGVGDSSFNLTGMPYGIAFDSSGDLYVADGNVIQMLAATSGTHLGVSSSAGSVYTVAGTGTAGYAGDGGPATSAKLSSPEGIGLDAAGNLYIADTNNDLVRVVANVTGSVHGVAMAPGEITTLAGVVGTLGTAGSGGPATSADLSAPYAISVDPAGDVYVANDYYNTGSASFNSYVDMLPASSGTYFGQAMTAGDLYAVAGNGTAGYAGDGGPATAAELTDPKGVSLDYFGGLLIADGNLVRAVSGGPALGFVHFTSAATATLDAGAPGSLTVTAVSTAPSLTLSVVGPLPAGLAFTDNGNGTATISGTPSAPGTAMLDLQATSTAGTTLQHLLLTVAAGSASSTTTPTTPSPGSGGTPVASCAPTMPQGFSVHPGLAVVTAAGATDVVHVGTRSTARLVVPAGALPVGTTVGVAPALDLAVARAGVPPLDAGVGAFAVAWSGPGCVTTAPAAPLTLEISGPGIVGDVALRTGASGRLGAAGRVSATQGIDLPVQSAAQVYLAETPTTVLLAHKLAPEATSVGVHLACRAGTRCDATSTISVARRSSGRIRHVALATAGMAIRDGAAPVVVYALTPFGRQLLAAHHGHPFAATLLVTTTGGNRLVRRVAF